MLLEIPDIQHINVETIPAAIAQLQGNPGRARVIAGATDLLGLMKDRVAGPECKIPEILINIKSIPEMNWIAEDEEGDLRIGATTTLGCLENSDLVKRKFNILAQAAAQVGTTQIRNMGTIGGNLCQRPRCMYFRHPHFVCYKKGGTKCFAIAGEHRDYHAIFGKGRCVMAHPSDMAPALIALQAKAIIAGPGGEKRIPLQDFFLGPNDFYETLLKPDEFLKAVLVPHSTGTSYQIFLKHRIRKAVDFAIASVAAVAQMSDGVCEDIRIVLGGVAPFPYLAPKAEQIIRGKRLSEELIAQAGEASIEGARPLSMNAYKIDLVKAMVRRALTSIGQQAFPK
jgi:xanthine dehydrogenase YagS FAD-binding subunit